MMIEKLQITNDFTSKINELVDFHNMLDASLKKFLQRLHAIQTGEVKEDVQREITR